MLIRFEKIRYILCGGLTTMVNMGSFSVLIYGMGLSASAANGIAWWISVVYAYAANKALVFQGSTAKKILEFSRFCLCRIVSGTIETLSIYIFCDVIAFPALPVKIVLSAAVLGINYIGSKKWVFSEN